MSTPDGVLEVGSIFQGGYEVLGEIGAGTFARVYEARQLSTGQKVAIKVLRPSDESGQEERFRREMLLAGRLSHPNIVRLIDSGETDSSLLYAVFQYVPGVTLKQVLASEGKLGIREALHLMGQVLDALSCAHAEGVVHRDLKPENIMVTQTGVRRNAMVLDFGLGAFAQEGGRRPPGLTASRDLMGTPCYAAPEQLRGEPPSVRSDLYSWGLTLIECLTGELAISGGSAQEVVYKQLGPEPVPIPAWLRGHALGPLLHAVTQKKVEKRDVAVTGLLEALSAILSADASPTPEPPEAGEAAGERRQVTVLCCQTTLSVAGDREVQLEDLDEMIQLQQEAQTRIVLRNGGQPAGAMAERAMFVFGYPTAHEDDSLRAVRAGVQITAEMVQTNERLRSERGLEAVVRVGAHTGMIVVRSLGRSPGQALGRLVGLTPRIAGELAQRAGVNEVVASADTVRLLREEFDRASAGELTLAETATSLEVFRMEAKPAGRAGRDTLSPRQETTLIGRSGPLAELRQAWEKTQIGQPGAILLRGDPGIGKSRLLRELRRIVPSASWLQTRCLVEERDSPLRPFADLLAGVDEPLEELLLRLGFDLAETLPLFGSLLNWPAERYTPLAVSPERQKELTLGALVEVFRRLAEARPIVFTVEDLHWADATTLELLGLMLRDLTPTSAHHPPRLLAVFTARPEFEPEALPNLAILPLARLDDRQVAEMITAALGPDAELERSVIDEVVRRADGIPLFIEEVTKTLTGDDSAAARSRALQVPATLRDLLVGRLDRVPPKAKETALLAAVLGREFRYEVLRAVSGAEEDDLRDALADLQASGLVFHRRSVRSGSYSFKHALLRDAAYDSLTRGNRQRLHQRVANTLRHRFPDIERNRPEILARHFEHGGQTETAVEYFHRAGSQALHRAAYREAVGLLEHGLSLTRSLEESIGRRRQEAELLSTIGGVQISLRGYAATEVEQLFREAGELCEGLEGDIATHVLFGVWAVAITRSDAVAVPALLPRFRRIIDHSGDPVARLTAFSALGCGAYWRGQFEESEEHFIQGRLLFSTDEFQQFSRTYGYSAGLYAYAIGMLNLWCLGYADRARAVRTEFLDIAAVARDPYVTVAALGLGLTLAHDCDEPEAELELADRLLRLAEEQRLPMWWGAASLGRGGALLRRGHAEQALPLILDGLERYRATGVNCSYNHFLQYLADAYLQLGRTADALAVIQQSQSLCRTLWARSHEPEMLRLRGEVELLCGDPEAAEASFRAAIDLARSFAGRSYELRAASCLSRLLRSRGEKAAARENLGGVVEWFSEGFDTADLRQARALLAEL